MENPLKLEDMSKSVANVPEHSETRKQFLSKALPGAPDPTALFRFMLLKGSTRHFVHTWLLALRKSENLDYSVHPTLATSLTKSYALIYKTQTPESRLQISMSHFSDLVMTYLLFWVGVGVVVCSFRHSTCKPYSRISVHACRCR